MTKKAEALLKIRDMSIEALQTLCNKEQRSIIVSRLEASSIEKAESDKASKREAKKNVARMQTILREKTAALIQ